jgi:hypothetical protein
MLALSDDQRAVVEYELDGYQLVLAGPGTGKTHALVARLSYLIESGGLRPGSEILLLTFSRAAVSEIKSRLREAGGNVSYVRVQTFDSFATSILSEVDPEGTWVDLGYDGRIQQATKYIQDDPFAGDLLGDIKHLLVDEIQDVLGVRLQLVKALLSVCGMAYTLFGDPAQCVYTFGLDGSVDKRTAPWELPTWLRGEYLSELKVTTFDENRRAENGSKSAKCALWAGPALLGSTEEFQTGDGDIDYDLIYDGLFLNLLGLRSLGQSEYAFPLTSTDFQQTAILTRTNIEALLISEQLWENGVAHSLERPAVDRALPAWIAKVLQKFDTPSVGNQTFESLYPNDTVGFAPDPSEAWTILKRIERGGARNSLDLRKIAQNIASGHLPDDLTTSPRMRLAVSTIHRAKGREFEETLIALSTFDPKSGANEFEAAEEGRILFVAMTRSKLESKHLEPPSRKGYHLQTGSNRWYKWDYQKRRALEISVTSEDISRSGLSVPCGLSGSDIEDCQDYIFDSIRPGDAAELRLVSASAKPDETMYAAYHQDRIVGSTSPRFATSLQGLVDRTQNGTIGWPSQITGLYYEAADSVAEPSSTSDAGLTQNRVWIRPRVYGIGKLKY